MGIDDAYVTAIAAVFSVFIVTLWYLSLYMIFTNKPFPGMVAFVITTAAAATATLILVF